MNRSSMNIKNRSLTRGGTGMNKNREAIDQNESVYESP